MHVLIFFRVDDFSFVWSKNFASYDFKFSDFLGKASEACVKENKNRFHTIDTEKISKWR